MALGPSGSGKSTQFKKLKEKNPNLEHYSWDALRLAWYAPDDYSKAWELASQDKLFYDKAWLEFRRLIVDRKDIYVDNVNSTEKSRSKFMYEGKRNGYKCIAYTFDVDLKTLLERQKSRADKVVPVEAVKEQYQRYEPPRYNEFDEVRKVTQSKNHK